MKDCANGVGWGMGRETPWQTRCIDPKQASGTWYLETGSGMGATLNTAVGKSAYALADRGTWLSFGNKDRDKDALIEPRGLGSRTLHE